MNLTEKEIIYPTDERFDLIKELCHLSKNLYNAALYDVRQYYFETKLYRSWKSQRPIFTEESYTSKASFFDKDYLPKYGESDNHKFSGRRIKRGLYKDGKGYIWNADLNGAANIMRKCSDKAYKGIRKTKEMMKRPILVTL